MKNRRLISFSSTDNNNYHVIISEYKVNRFGLIQANIDSREYKNISLSSATRIIDIIHNNKHDITVDNYGLRIISQVERIL